MKKRKSLVFPLIKYGLLTLGILGIIAFIIKYIVVILWILLFVALIGGGILIMIHISKQEYKKQKAVKKEEELNNFRKAYLSILEKEHQKEQQKQHKTNNIPKRHERHVFQNDLNSVDETDFTHDFQNQTQEQTYRAKEQLVTQNEKGYLSAIESCIDLNRYNIHSQIALSSIVEKIDNSRYHNELFRSIDFVITDKEQKVLLCIEINDKSHNRFDRQERDHKVKAILEEAGIPLVTFWTKYGINEEYISKRINEVLQSHS